MTFSLDTTHRTVDPASLSAKTRAAIAKYGYATCVIAYARNSVHGDGPATIKDTTHGLKTVASANAAIDAGREIETGVQTCEFDKVLGTETRGNYHEGKTTLGKFLQGKKIDSVWYTKMDGCRVVVSIKYATFTNFRATLTTIQFDALLRSLPEGIAQKF